MSCRRYRRGSRDDDGNKKDESERHMNSSHLDHRSGAALERLGLLGAALEQYRRECGQAPKDASAHLALALAALRAGRAAEALNAAQSAHHLAPCSALALWAAGRAAQELERWSEAERYYRDALALDASLADAAQSLAMLAQRQGRTDQAVASLAKGVILRHGALWRGNTVRMLGVLAHDVRLSGLIDTDVMGRLDSALHEECGKATRFQSRHCDAAPGSGGHRAVHLLTVWNHAPRRALVLGLADALAHCRPEWSLRVFATDRLAEDTAVPSDSGRLAVIGCAGLGSEPLALALAGKETVCAIDLDWGDECSRFEALALNTTTIRMAWDTESGRLSVTTANLPRSSDLQAGTSITAEGHRHRRRLQRLVSDDPNLSGGAGEAAAILAALIDDAVTVAERHRRLPRTSKGWAPPDFSSQIRQRDKAQDLVPDWVGERVRHEIWLEQIRGKAVSFTPETRAAGLLVAVVTPYGDEDEATLRRTHESVIAQQGGVRHIFVACGQSHPMIDEWEADHLLLADFAPTHPVKALALGTAFAVSRGADAVCYLPPGNRFKRDHVRRLAAAAVKGHDLVMSRAALVDETGHEYRSHVHTGNVPVHHDTAISTFLLYDRALDLAPLWAAVPKGAEFFATGLFRSAINARHYRQLLLPAGTVACAMKDAYSWREICRRDAPAQCLPLGFKEQALLRADDTPAAIWLSALAAFHTDRPLPPARPGLQFDPWGYLGGGERPRIVSGWPDRTEMADHDLAAALERHGVAADAEILAASEITAVLGDDLAFKAWESDLCHARPAASLVAARLVASVAGFPLGMVGTDALVRPLDDVLTQLQIAGLRLAGIHLLDKSPCGRAVDCLVILRRSSLSGRISP